MSKRGKESADGKAVGDASAVQGKYDGIGGVASSYSTPRSGMEMTEIRELARADLGQIEPIERRSYPTPWSRSMFASELAKPSSICLGAFEADNGLVGYLIISRYVDAWHVMNIAVDPDHRGRGVAKALFDRLFELTAGDGARGFTLEVRVSNKEAIRLYDRLGFRSKGVRRGYYTDNREDALIMWKEPVLSRQEAGAAKA
jgi:[ribosomal protein S18]-alanine N-acetyltransferase